MNETAPKTQITSFPTETLKASLGLVKKVIDQRGDQISTAKEISLATGIPLGSLSLPLSSASQYGILVSAYGSGYRPTELYYKIQNPTYEHEKLVAEYEALCSPQLYKRLISDFNGKQLPNDLGLANHLSKTFGFKQYAIPKIVKAFFENFRPSIDSTNRLRLLPPIKKDASVETIIQDVEQEQVIETKSLPQNITRERHRNFQQPIPLPDDKMIILEYPKGNMTSEDFTALKAFIAFLEITEKRKENE